MKQTRIMMDMPITVEVDGAEETSIFDQVFSYFKYVDDTFSTFKKTSEITKINDDNWPKEKWSKDMKEIFRLSEETKRLTGGYFDILTAEKKFDPSGLVKGWSIHNAAMIIEKNHFPAFFVDAGGDIEARGKVWKVGIRNPFNRSELVKVVYLKDKGIATSGIYIRGEHIYNPQNDHQSVNEIVSLTVIGPDIYEADRFATAAFAMGKKGIMFIEGLPGFEGYMIDKDGMAIMTSGFEKYTKTPNA